MKRLFIAIPIEKKWEKIFEKYRDPMGEFSWLKWEPLPKLHVTVLFVGNTDEELIPEIEDALTDIGMAQQPFTIALERMTYAPEDSVKRDEFDALILTVLMVQFSWRSGPALATGTLASWVTITWSVSVQPLTGSVTCSV